MSAVWAASPTSALWVRSTPTNATTKAYSCCGITDARACPPPPLSALCPPTILPQLLGRFFSRSGAAAILVKFIASEEKAMVLFLRFVAGLFCFGFA